MDKEQAKRFSDHSSDMDFLFEKTLEFAKKIPAGIPFVEVGTRAGGSALLFAVAIQESKIQRPLFTIDPYGNKPYLRGKEVLNMNYNDGYYLTAMKELANFCQETKQFHYHWRMRSLDFIKIYDSIPMWFEGKEIPKEIGFAYLDGDHEENTIQEEITWFSSKMKYNGLVVIDDSEYVIESEKPIIKQFIENGYQHSNRLYFEI